MKNHLFCLAVALGATTGASWAQAPRNLGALFGGGKLWLHNGVLRASDAKGATRWVLSRTQAGLAGFDKSRPDFEANSVVFSVDRRLIAVRGEEEAQIRSVFTGKLRFSCSLYESAPALARTISAPSLLIGFQKVGIPGAGNYVTGMAFSPYGDSFALSGWQNVELGDGSVDVPPTIVPSGRVRVWSLRTRKPTHVFNVKGAHVQGARWVSNRKLQATCGDGRFRYFSLSR